MMCCCGKPVINGQPGYSWDGKSFSVRRVDPPELKDGDELLYDEPGRCGGIDSHCHHLRLVRRLGHYYLLVRNGCGDERIGFHSPFSIVMKTGLLDSLDTNARYWLLLSMYYAHDYGDTTGRDETNSLWRRAAAEKRIKTRKQRGRDAVKVWMEPVEV